MATAPAATSALLSETDEPPPPVLGAPAGTAPPDFAGALLDLLSPEAAGLLSLEPLALVSLDEPLVVLLDVELELEPAAEPGTTATVDPPLLDLLGAESLLDLLGLLLEPVEVSIFMPGGILVRSEPDEEEPDEDEPDEDEPDEDEPEEDADPAAEPAELEVGFAAGVAADFAGGIVTATVLPPEEEPPVAVDEVADFAVGKVTTVVLPPEELPPEADEADVDLAVGRVTGTVLPALVEAALGVAVTALLGAAGALALDVVSFCDHRPISESTPARTAIAMIAPTTQDVLFG